jgi:hypothetical protein
MDDGEYERLTDRLEALDRLVGRLMADHEARDLERHSSEQASVREQFAASAKAIEKAETAADKRFDAVNEFRAQLADQTRTFMPRAEYDRAHADLVQRVGALADTVGGRVGRLEERVSKSDGKGLGLAQGWGYLVAAAAIVAAVATVIFYASR